MKQIRSNSSLDNVSQFINKFSDIAPLSSLTQKGKKLIWSVECEDDFHALKTALTVLSYTSSNETYILDTDASDDETKYQECQNLTEEWQD